MIDYTDNNINIYLLSVLLAFVPSAMDWYKFKKQTLMSMKNDKWKVNELHAQSATLMLPSSYF